MFSRSRLLSTSNIRVASLNCLYPQATKTWCFGYMIIWAMCMQLMTMCMLIIKYQLINNVNRQAEGAYFYEWTVPYLVGIMAWCQAIIWIKSDCCQLDSTKHHKEILLENQLFWLTKMHLKYLILFYGQFVSAPMCSTRKNELEMRRLQVVAVRSELMLAHFGPSYHGLYPSFKM